MWFIGAVLCVVAFVAFPPLFWVALALVGLALLSEM